MYPFVQVPIGAGLGLFLLLLAGAWFGLAPRLGLAEVRSRAAFLAAAGLALILAHFVHGEALTVFHWPTYGIMLLLGALVVVGIGMKWAADRGLRSDLVVELGLIGLIFGLLGARAVHVVEQWDARFADRPASVRLGTPRTPLAPGEILRLETSEGMAEVVFSGGDSPAEVAAALNSQAGRIGLEAEVVTIRHRAAQGLEEHARGLLLRTKARGPAALLRLHGGPAAQRFAPSLVLQQAAEIRGVAVPWTRIFDLSGGGLTYFGSVLGVLISCGLWLRYRKVRPLVVLDLMAPLLPLGLFFGRLGCTAFGCCWGRELGEAVPWPGFRFPPGSPSWRQMAEERLSCEFDPLLDAISHHTLHVRGAPVEEILRETVKETPGLTRLASEALPQLQDIATGTPALHPAQLYEGLGILVVVGLLWLYRARFQRRLGQCFLLVFLLQAPLRFAVEHMRRDHGVFFQVSWLDYSFTESQLVALAFFAGALPAFVFLSLRGERLETSEEPQQVSAPPPALAPLRPDTTPLSADHTPATQASPAPATPALPEAAGGSEAPPGA